MRHRTFLGGASAAVVFASALLAVALPSPSLAQAAAVTIDSRAPALEEVDSGGWTASLGFTNLTNAAVELEVAPSDAGDRGCTLQLNKEELPPAEHADVNVTIPAGCQVGDDGIDFVVSSAQDPPVEFEITAAPKPEADEPEWSALYAFPIALGAALLGAFALLALSKDSRAPNRPLKYLEEAWSFKDSWVSNITVVGGLLTGIFGSAEVVKAFLGEDAERSVALATVGAAIAVAFIAAGPIALFATRTKQDDYFTVGGLLLASAITAAGAGGEIWVLYRSGRKLDLGGFEDLIVVAAVAALVLLVLYAIRTLLATLKRGLNPKKPAPASDTIVAAKMIVEALKTQLPDLDERELQAAVDKVAASYPTVGTSPGDDYSAPMRSALL